MSNLELSPPLNFNLMNMLVISKMFIFFFLILTFSYFIYILFHYFIDVSTQHKVILNFDCFRKSVSFRVNVSFHYWFCFTLYDISL